MILQRVLVLTVLLTSAAPCFGAKGFSLVGEDPSVSNRDYHFGFGVAKFSEIGNKYNHYEKLFSSPSLYPTFWIERSALALPFGIDLSGGLRFGYYSDEGKSAKRSSTLVLDGGELDRDLDDSEVDASQQSRLTMIPIDLVLNASISPFAGRWVAANVWAGWGFNFVENTTQAKLASDVDQSEVTPFVNSGWNKELVTGASLSFDITKLDSISSYSLKVYGVESIFITPFLQIVKTLENEVGTYDREMYGLMFTFETWR